jgi:hypothetical protein
VKAENKMRKVSILIVGVGALSVIISLLIPKPTSNQDYWTDEQQESLDKARNRAHHLSDHHGDATKEQEYEEALVVFKAEQGKLNSAKSRSVLFPRLLFWLGISVAVLGVTSLVISLSRQTSTS